MAQPPESPNPLAASVGCKSALPSTVSEPRVRAFARVPRGARRRARCIPALPLPINSGSGLAETNAINGSECLHPPGCPSPDTERVNAASNDGRVESDAPPARDFIETGYSRHSFRVCTRARHHPLARTRRSNCLAGTTPRPRRTSANAARVQALPGPTGSTLVRVRLLNHRRTFAGTGHHSGRHTPCAVSLILRCSSHVGRTSSRPGRPGMPEAPASARFAVPPRD